MVKHPCIVNREVAFIVWQEIKSTIFEKHVDNLFSSMDASPMKCAELGKSVDTVNVNRMLIIAFINRNSILMLLYVLVIILTAIVIFTVFDDIGKSFKSWYLLRNIY